MTLADWLRQCVQTIAAALQARLQERLSQVDGSRGLADPDGKGLETIEHIATELHEQYRAAARRLGWQMKPEVDVPYSLLQEDAKELDRVFARWHLAKLAAIQRRDDELARVKRTLVAVCEDLFSDECPKGGTCDTYAHDEDCGLASARAHVANLKAQHAAALARIKELEADRG